jgi:4-hydroxy-3-polyprenylbenzoate decarboxylase
MENASEGRVVVALCGEVGLDYGIRTLERLRELDAETDLVVCARASAALGPAAPAVRALATRVHAEHNQAARIASGSFLTSGMVVVPCDAGSLAAISLGLATTLAYRAADVTLKERRPLVLAVPSGTPPRTPDVPGLTVLTLGGPLDETVDRLLEPLRVG